MEINPPVSWSPKGGCFVPFRQRGVVTFLEGGGGVLSSKVQKKGLTAGKKKLPKMSFQAQNRFFCRICVIYEAFF